MEKVFIDGLSFALPLLIMAVGAIYSEKSGVTNLAVEGFQGVGAFVGAFVGALVVSVTDVGVVSLGTDDSDVSEEISVSEELSDVSVCEVLSELASFSDSVVDSLGSV